MQSRNTEVGIGFLLKVEEVKIMPNGIELFFAPLLKTVLVSSLDSILTKDHASFVLCIKPYQKSILLATNLNHPKIYANRLNSEKGIIKEIYSKGEDFAEVIQILK